MSEPETIKHGGPAAISAERVHALIARGGETIEETMVGLLGRAAGYAQAAISGFKVGAVVRGLSGGLYLGGNFEFLGKSLAFDIHAEQAAVVNAWLAGEVAIDTLAVTSPPCGYCRQFLNELDSAERIRVIVPGRPERTLAELFPDSFGPRDLGLSGGLMLPQEHPLELEEPSTDPVVRAALQAAEMSYAPYTRAFAGAALLAADGGICRGPYAENAAFNPSLSPLETALVRLLTRGKKYREIRRAVVVEQREAATSQAEAARIVLEAIAPRAVLDVAYARAADKEEDSSRLAGDQHRNPQS